MPFFNSIVVAIDGSDASIFAAKYAIVLAKTCGSKLSAVYVVDTATIEQLTLSNIFIQEEGLEYKQSLESSGERYLSFAEELAKAKGIKLEKKIRYGEVHSEILAEADEKKADLIILGGWEKDRNPRDIVSHFCREVMANAKCSVLLAKEPDIDKIYKNV